MKLIVAACAIFSIFLGCAYQTELGTAGPLRSTDSIDKSRSYSFGYDQTFEATFNAISKLNLKVVKLDKNMGAIVASNHIGPYIGGWTEYYKISVKETNPAETTVYVKLTNIKPGSVYAPMDVAASSHSSSFPRTPLESSLKKVNAVYTNIQQELGIEKKFTLRGLLWD